MSTQSDPNRHEASREAFEAIWPKYSRKRKPNGKYVATFPMQRAWKDWCRALDWRDSQVCGWKYCEHDYFWDTECGDAFYFENDGPAENNVRFCHGCGRRVKIQP